MGISDPSFLGLIRSKVRSWIVDLSWVSCGDDWMSSEDMGDQTVCHDCRSSLVVPRFGVCRCQCCRRVFCSECMSASSRSYSWKFPEEADLFRIELCKFCSQAVSKDGDMDSRLEEKLVRMMSSNKSIRADHIADDNQSEPLHLQCSTIRSFEEDDDDDEDDYGKNFLSPSSVFSHDVSDLDSSCFSTGTDFYSFKSSPLDSPSRADQQSVSTPTSTHKQVVPDQEPAAYVRTPRSENEELIDQASDYVENREPYFKEVLNLDNLESDGNIWIPPPPKDAADDMEVDFFRYDDEDDSVGGIGHVIKSSSFDDCAFSIGDGPNDDQKELLRDSVHGHFRVLVSQMLRDEGICDKRNGGDSIWLGIASSLAWQAANFVKPDTSREGSMDPGDYVKVKCMLTGSPSDSSFIKGIVCTRNVRHKRMTTQYKNPRVLIFGGELDFQKVPHKLASMNTLITDQKSDFLDMSFSKIEALKPNVLLVERSVSPNAVQYMLAKGISLVTNVKRCLLQRISRCTGARITESIDDLPSTRVGNCEAFFIRRVAEECLNGNCANRKSSKTLMFFDGCPKRLGCTILLNGMDLEELKKVKRVVQFAVFAAYQLSLETSFLADEGATLRKMQLGTSFGGHEPHMIGDFPPHLLEPSRHEMNIAEHQEPDAYGKFFSSHPLESGSAAPNIACVCTNFGEDATQPPVHANASCALGSVNEVAQFSKIHPTMNDFSSHDHPTKETENQLVDCYKSEENQNLSTSNMSCQENEKPDKVSENIMSKEFASTEKNQSILVSLSRSCKGMICGTSQLLRIKFYGSFDKPLGKFLHENLFSQGSNCEFCKEPMDAHVLCYTHQHGSLTINVKRLPSVRLPGERDGRIWMWHRCLKCASADGCPPAARRVIMSDSAWGLSFGKFLELSFSNHATANRLASCGHSLQRDCLRFYGFGSMMAFFRYAPIDILSVHLPPSKLDFSCQLQQKWLQQMSLNVSSKMETLHVEVLELLCGMERKICTSEFESIREILLNNIANHKLLLERERSSYDAFLHSAAIENSEVIQQSWDVLELNCARRSLLIEAYMWDRRILYLDAMLKEKGSSLNMNPPSPKIETYVSDGSLQGGKSDSYPIKNDSKSMSDVHVLVRNELSCPGPQSSENLSDKIDLAWTGSGDLAVVLEPRSKKVFPPQRFYSFDSTSRTREKVRTLSIDSRQLSSFNALAHEDRLASREVVQGLQKVSQHSYMQNLKFLFGSSPSFISSTSCMADDGARLLLPQSDDCNVFVAVYDDEPSSIISFALNSKEHAEFVSRATDKSLGRNSVPDFSTMQSFNYDDISFGFVKPEGMLPSYGTPTDTKQPHFRFAFDDESSFPSNKAKFSVTCYFAKQFSAIRKKCCPNEMDFIHSLSRCKKWTAEGGKSNAYFARSFDERFIIKQVTKTEMDSFDEFASQYFTYLTESINTGSPTCLAKILGIFQINVKHMKGGRELRMDLMVMENLFYGRNIWRAYDLKGSSRSRYISDSAGEKKVLLDSNLIEVLQTKPIFLGSKSKRKLERAVWNDTAFLASIDVMDYSLLVGVDDERKELVIGIIDYMRQYTWDKHLETWVKASGILGGPRNTAPTIISPKQYKKRFRKAMSSYFLTVPDQWPS